MIAVPARFDPSVQEELDDLLALVQESHLALTHPDFIIPEERKVTIPRIKELLKRAGEIADEILKELKAENSQPEPDGVNEDPSSTGLYRSP